MSDPRKQALEWEDFLERCREHNEEQERLTEAQEVGPDTSRLTGFPLWKFPPGKIPAMKPMEGKDGER